MDRLTTLRFFINGLNILKNYKCHNVFIDSETDILKFCCDNDNFLEYDIKELEDNRWRQKLGSWSFNISNLIIDPHEVIKTVEN